MGHCILFDNNSYSHLVEFLHEGQKATLISNPRILREPASHPRYKKNIEGIG